MGEKQGVHERVERRTIVDSTLIDYVLIDKRVVGRLVNVHVMRGEGRWRSVRSLLSTG